MFLRLNVSSSGSSFVVPKLPTSLKYSTLIHTLKMLKRVDMLLTLYLYKYPSNLVPVILPAYTVYEDGTDRMFRKFGT
jgi:hypothetical protein